MTKRVVALALVVLLAGGLVGAVVISVAGTGDDDGGTPSAATTTLPLNDTAKGLVDRLASARRRPLHAVFSGTLAGAAGATLTVELWWKGDQSRQTLVAEAPDQGRQETSGFVLKDGNVVCQRGQGQDWLCQHAGTTATPSGRTAGIIDAVVAQLGGKEVTVAKARVGDEEVDCYSIDPATSDVVCLRADDVPVRFTFSGADVQASRVDTDVDDDVFEPPAKVREAPTSSIT